VHRAGVEDADENADGWQIGQADDHVGQFRFGQPDAAARRKPVVTSQLTGLIGRAKHHRRSGGQRHASRVSDHDPFGHPDRAAKRSP